MHYLHSLEKTNDSHFYDIPNHSRYGISKEGVLLNKLTGKTTSGYVSSQGYYSFSLRNDFGGITYYRRHRLLCDIFKSDSKTPEKRVVNHINGVKGDDRLENLEWVTDKENVQHAWKNGMTPELVPLSVRDYDTGIVKKYESLSECSKDTGLNRDQVLYRLRIGEKRLFPDRKQYRRGHEDNPWYEVENSDIALAENGVSNAILVRHLITNEIKSYRQQRDLANELGVSEATITTWLNRKNQPVLPGYIQLKRCDENIGWRTVEDPEAEMLEFGCGKRVKTIDEVSGEEIIYESAKACAKANNLLVTTLNERLNKNGDRVFKDGKRYMRVH